MLLFRLIPFGAVKREVGSLVVSLVVSHLFIYAEGFFWEKKTTTERYEQGYDLGYETFEEVMHCTTGAVKKFRNFLWFESGLSRGWVIIRWIKALRL